jgi:hypothetical protein
MFVGGTGGEAEPAHGTVETPEAFLGQRRIRQKNIIS